MDLMATVAEGLLNAETDPSAHSQSSSNGDMNGTGLTYSSSSLEQMSPSSQQQQGASIILTVRLLMQGKEVGSIIGKAGQQVKLIRDSSGAKVNISDGSCSERIVTITGTAATIHGAFSMIARKFEEDLQAMANSVPKPPITMRLIVPATQCGSLIGKSGSKIKEIREKTGASIQVASEMLPNSTERAVTISGTCEALVDCMKEICIILQEAPAKGGTLSFRPKPSYNPLLIASSAAAVAAAQQQATQQIATALLQQQQGYGSGMQELARIQPYQPNHQNHFDITASTSTSSSANPHLPSSSSSSSTTRFNPPSSLAPAARTDLPAGLAGMLSAAAANGLASSPSISAGLHLLQQQQQQQQQMLMSGVGMDPMTLLALLQQQALQQQQQQQNEMGVSGILPQQLLQFQQQYELMQAMGLGLGVGVGGGGVQAPVNYFPATTNNSALTGRAMNINGYPLKKNAASPAAAGAPTITARQHSSTAAPAEPNSNIVIGGGGAKRFSPY